MNPVNTIEARTLKDWLRDGRELALLDVREQGDFSRGHLLFASNMPLSRLEPMLANLVPRRNARLVLCDAGDDGAARRAAAAAASFGYGDVSVLAGGTAGWRAAGHQIFSGVNVPSKAFGEHVEHRHDTPRIAARELAALGSAGTNMVILDSRPLEEFRTASIPGAIDCPGAELVYRVFDAAPDPDTLVVVNCAGRTRSIIGAQSLINAGVPNRVVALQDGTMGWQLAGLEPTHGCTGQAAAPSAEGLVRAQAAARAVGVRHGVREIEEAMLQGFRAERDARTLYLFDVRTREEYEAGHYPGSRHAPGGQLVQATDEFAPTRHARIVLIDGDGVRATMTASWLRQLGWDDVFVLRRATEGALDRGPYTPTLLDFEFVSSVTAQDLARELAGGADLLVVDCATSVQYRRRHVPGALWCMRTRLAQLPAAAACVFSSPNGVYAHYCARDLLRLRPQAGARVLEGGSRAWFDAGLAEESGAGRMIGEADDVWIKPYQRPEGAAAMQTYLRWETGLLEQVARDGDARFR
ncbi:MAG: hypothetical protein IT532_01125 [Burkholderiales bacterium]|nr:hypothetical protein [Burkholderiales bacterium]